jgi:hypothetical protein
VPWTGPALVALCLLALGLNPDGYRVIGSTIQMIGVSAPSVVVEWQSPDFKSPNQVAFLVAVLAFFGARALAGRCRSWLDIGVPAAVIMAGFQMRRMLPLLALTLAVFAARALRDWRSRQPARAAAAPAALDRLALNRELDPRITGAIHVVAIIAVAAIGVAIGPAVDDHFERQARLILPRHAADFIVEHDVRGRLFNTYNGGGYLIYRLFPGHRVFIDGRQTPYSPGLLADDNVIESGAPGWYERLERVAPELVLCETASPLHQLLELRDEFRQVYSDSYFSVLLRNDGRLPALPTVPTAGPPT